ncbi:MAG TPA: hypothetical protein VM869_28275 [Enhygromyxa sp.]|nr:hypothetical protein [Enhygromyxa sp.]
MLNSFEKLEIALALRCAAANTLAVPELSTKLRLASHIVERGIEELARAGGVQFTGDAARLTLDSTELAALDEIAVLYEEDRLLVVRTLTEISLDKIRGIAARRFADAFQLRKKKEEDGDA